MRGTTRVHVRHTARWRALCISSAVGFAALLTSSLVGLCLTGSPLVLAPPPAFAYLAFRALSRAHAEEARHVWALEVLDRVGAEQAVETLRLVHAFTPEEGQATVERKGKSDPV